MTPCVVAALALVIAVKPAYLRQLRGRLDELRCLLNGAASLVEQVRDQLGNDRASRLV